MKLLVDMNLSPAWAGFLRAAGYAAEHWSVLGPPGADDAEIMAFARIHGMVVLTHDLDFSAILAATQGEKPSVVQVRAGDLGLDAIGAEVLAALAQTASILEEGALVTVEAGRTRLRVLPLKPS